MYIKESPKYLRNHKYHLGRYTYNLIINWKFDLQITFRHNLSKIRNVIYTRIIICKCHIFCRDSFLHKLKYL